ncbi:MAG TPA: hypothetical protein VG847_12700 [Chitinophagaceae bacterium]|nr:hypothetical protein [Chitinophagaceae bacterium]
MKKLVLTTTIIFLASLSFAQSEKYESAMKANISQLDSMMGKGNSLELANNFERIANAEKTQWLPYYYAAYCTVVQAYTEQDNSKKDDIADKAQQLINKADSLLGKESSETDVIKSMIATAHMMVDPQSRYMTYGPQSNELIEKSESLDSTNPRPVLLKAENTFYTPEQFGGGKDAAKPLFDKAKELADNFKPETDLSPNWGNSAINYFLSQYK